MTVSVLTSKEHKSREAYFPPLILFVFFLPCMDRYVTGPYILAPQQHLTNHGYGSLFDLPVLGSLHEAEFRFLVVGLITIHVRACWQSVGLDFALCCITSKTASWINERPCIENDQKLNYLRRERSKRKDAYPVLYEDSTWRGQKWKFDDDRIWMCSRARHVDTRQYRDPQQLFQAVPGDIIKGNGWYTRGNFEAVWVHGMRSAFSILSTWHMHRWSVHETQASPRDSNRALGL